MPLDPRHKKIYDFLLLSLCQPAALFDPVPFFETAPAAATAGVLSLENGMSFHGGLAAVVFRKSGGKALSDKILGVTANGFGSFGRDIFEIFLVQMKGTAKFRPFKAVESLVYGLQNTTFKQLKKS